MNVEGRLAAVVLARDEHCCVSCGKPCRPGDARLLHLVPPLPGAVEEAANLVTLCAACAQRFQARTPARSRPGWPTRAALKLAQWLDSEAALPAALANLRHGLHLLGARRLREGQLAVILAALQGQSVLMVSPTGSGKTLCFQLPTLLQDGTAYVISPLKALMTEQVLDLQQRGIPSTYINGDVPAREKHLRYRRLQNQAYKFFYCTPERFDETRVRGEEVGRLLAGRPRYLVIDEAHCIDRWGDDFRPSYSRLGEVRRRLGSPAVLAFTATAGVKTQQRILQSLGIPEARVVVSGVDRPNIALLRLTVEDDARRAAMVGQLLAAMPAGRAMIFVPTVRVGEAVQAALQGQGLDVPFYHSKMGSPAARARLLGRFSGRDTPALNVIVCTSAFGMGLDVPDVRLVIHWQHPSSVEDYLQEFGRAGRDRKQALAVLFRKPRDNGLLRFMAEKTIENADLDDEARTWALRAKLAAIDDMSTLANRREGCFRAAILRYFLDDSGPSSPSPGLRLVSWLFEEPVARRPVRYCCDACDEVTARNYVEWAKAAWRG